MNQSRPLNEEMRSVVRDFRTDGSVNQAVGDAVYEARGVAVNEAMGVLQSYVRQIQQTTLIVSNGIDHPGMMVSNPLMHKHRSVEYFILGQRTS